MIVLIPDHCLSIYFPIQSAAASLLSVNPFALMSWELIKANGFTLRMAAH